MRGYFGIGIEGVSKPMNTGSLMRTAHAFGASFFFTVGADYPERVGRQADTSSAPGEMPVYAFDGMDDFMLPRDCGLIGIELAADAIELPTFRHPRQCAYVLGPERGSLSPAMTGLCDQVVKIPTKFCVNVAVAGAIVMYDRLLNLGRHVARPLIPGGEGEVPKPHVFGEPVWRRKERRRAAAAHRVD